MYVKFLLIHIINTYSTVTDFAKFRGWSQLCPLKMVKW